MRKVMPTCLLLAASFMPTFILPARAQETDAMRTTTQTVWIKGENQVELTDKANKMHAEMSAKGFKFVAITPYSRNGDVDGMFLTYVRE